MFGSDVGSVVGGLINSGRGLPTIDLSALLATIKGNQQTNESLTNNFNDKLPALYQAYQDALTKSGATLQGSTDTIGQNLLDKTNALYGPNSDAVKATLMGLKQQDYSTLPGTIQALKANLAASGGLSRGGAARAITQATLAPAAQYSQQAATVTGNQLQQQQQGVQAALNKIASMDDATANTLFGMTKEQATQILTGGRADLKQQLSDLVNNNNQATNQMLGVEGIQAQNGYQNALTRDAQQTAIVNGLVNLGVDGASMFAGGMPGGAGAAAGAGAGGGGQFAALASHGTSFPGALTL